MVFVSQDYEMVYRVWCSTFFLLLMSFEFLSPAGRKTTVSEKALVRIYEQQGACHGAEQRFIPARSMKVTAVLALSRVGPTNFSRLDLSSVRIKA